MRVWHPSGPRVLLMSSECTLPMCPEWTEWIWLAALDDFRNWLIREAA
jgi:hypothetical protein